MSADILDRLSILNVKLKRLPKQKHDSIYEEIRSIAQEADLSLQIARDEFNELYELNEKAWDANEVLYHQLDRVSGLELKEPERSVIDAMKVSVDLNKQRIKIKNVIDKKLGNGRREEKSFDV